MDLDRQRLEQFQRDGFLVFPGLFSKSEIAALAFFFSTNATLHDLDYTSEIASA